MTLRQLPPLPARRLPPRVEHRLAVELNATVVGRTDLTDAVMVLRVRPDEALPFAAGQYVSLGMMLDGRLVQRPYSPASSPAQRELELLVRHVRGGELTPHLWRLANGDRVRLGRAKGLFRLEDDDERQHLFVATGTGVAPMIAMIGELLQRPSQPKITLLHGVGHQRELAFADRIGAWQRAGHRISYLPAVSRPEHPENAEWLAWAGRLTALLPELLQESSCLPPRTVAYLCGNPAVVSGVRDGLMRHGVPADAIRHEEYWPIS